MGRKPIGPGPGKYALKPVVGYKDHDPSKFRNPQYTIASKYPMVSKPIGPGPLAYQTSKLTEHGLTSVPAYSIRGKSKSLTPFVTPSPASYNTSTKQPSPPSFTMPKRYKTLTPFYGPGPNQYIIPSTIGPKVPDIKANAAYTMAHKTAYHKEQPNPGPAKYGGTDLNLYRSKTPKYTIPSRSFPPSGKSLGPGPLAYFPKLPQKPGITIPGRTEIEPYVTPEDDMPCVRRQKVC